MAALLTRTAKTSTSHKSRRQGRQCLRRAAALPVPAKPALRAKPARAHRPQGPARHLWLASHVESWPEDIASPEPSTLSPAVELRAVAQSARAAWERFKLHITPTGQSFQIKADKQPPSSIVWPGPGVCKGPELGNAGHPHHGRS